MSEELKSEQPSEQFNTKEIKKAVMKKLIEIMDEDESCEDEGHINDDQTIKETPRDEQ